MADNFIQPGDVMTITAPAATVAGQLQGEGLLVGVAQSDAPSGAAVEIAVRGVFRVAKASAQAWAVGAAVYYIPVSKLATTAATAGNILIGVAAAVAGNPSPSGIVRLNGSAPAAAAT